jgi:NAD+ synthase
LLMKPEGESSPSPAAIIEAAIGWIRHQVKLAAANGVVLGMSGGLDSSVLGVLCKRALGPSALALIMPCHSDPSDAAHARLVADLVDISTETVDLTPVFDQLVGILPSGDRLAVANLKPRLRMMVLYYFANRLGYLVMGSGNRSELMVGYCTKHGDAAADLLPLGGLYKTQVREMAMELNMPQEIMDKPPSAGLWQGQTDEGEMGISYQELDQALAFLQGGSPLSAPNDEVLEKVRRMVANSQHKRLPIPIFTP